MSFAVEHRPDAVHVILSAELTVGDAAALHQAVSEVVRSEAPVVVEESNVTAVDTSALQLVLALARSRQHAALEFRLGDGVVRSRLRELGLEGQLPA